MLCIICLRSCAWVAPALQDGLQGASASDGRELARASARPQSQCRGRRFCGPRRQGWVPRAPPHAPAHTPAIMPDVDAEASHSPPMCLRSCWLPRVRCFRLLRVNGGICPAVARRPCTTDARLCALLPGAAPGTLFLGIDNSMAAEGGDHVVCAVTLFAPYWLENRTGAPTLLPYPSPPMPPLCTQWSCPGSPSVAGS